MTLKRAIKLLLIYTKANQLISWEYRFNYVFRIFRIFFDFLISFVFIDVIFSQAPSIYGWTKPQIFLIYAIYQIINSTLSFFCADSLNDLDRDVRRGDLDLILTKPVDSQFAVSFRTIYPSNIYRIISSVIIIIYAFRLLDLQPSPLAFLLSFISIVSGIIIFYCFILFTAASVFWTMRGEIVDLVVTIFSTTRYPLDIFGKKASYIFTVIPLIFIATVPAKVLLGKPDILHYFSPIVAIVLLITSRRFWHFALRHYSSASS